MSGKSTLFANEFLDLIFLGQSIPDLADNAASTPATSLWMSLHTADPGPDGNQANFEVGYVGYNRVAVTRDTSGFTEALGGITNPVAPIQWPTSGGGTGIIASFWGIGLGDSGPGTLLYSGPITPPIDCGLGVAPQLTTQSSIEEQ
jgi:hypothetical protein